MSFIPSPSGLNAFGTNNLHSFAILSQFVIGRDLNNVSVPQEKFTTELILYVPVAENVCEGVKEVEVLFAPLAGSPKFQLMLKMPDVFGIEKAAPCWEGYVQRGMKPGKDGKPVPNCVPASKSANLSFGKDYTTAVQLDSFNCCPEE